MFTTKLQRIQDSIYSSVPQEILYSLDSHEDRSWPTSSWWNKPLDTTLIDIIKDIGGVDTVSLDDKLESDIGFDNVDVMDLYLKVLKAFNTLHPHVCPFVTWGEVCLYLSKEDKVPFYDYSVAELIDMIVRSGITKKPLSKQVKEALLKYDFSKYLRAENLGDKFQLRVFKTHLEPGVFFITDPFVLNNKQHNTVDDIMQLFYHEEHRKSDALFAEIVNLIGSYHISYITRTAIANSSLSYAKKVEAVQANYRLMRDGNGYYVLKTDNEPLVLKIAEEFRRVLIDELHFMDLC